MNLKLSAVFIYVLPTLNLFGQPTNLSQEGIDVTSRITIRIVDERGNLTPARAWVEVDSQRMLQSITPETATVYLRDQSFSCDGTFSIEIPAGNATVHVEKGKEYRPVDLSFAVSSGDTIDRTVKLQRWINMPAEGWYSADLHVHLGQDKPRVLKQLALADDVHVVPAFTYWLRGRGETWNDRWPDDSYTTPIQVDATHLVTRNNIEIERINRNAVPGGSIGATFLYNLNLPVTADLYGEHFPTDAALCLSAQSHSPGVVLDSDKPSWAETVIGVALGALNTIQVCHNHYHRTSTLPGGWGMIGPLETGESNEAVADGLFHRTNELYYRFLNCGFRLGVSGGSAIGVMPVATGQHRVYARVREGLTTEMFWKAVKEGRSFATSGPMIDLKLGRYPIGSTLYRAASVPVPYEIQASVRSIESLEALQIISNGRIVASLDLIGKRADPVLDEKLDFGLLPERSGWVLARALYRAPDGLLRQAHTSPIYIIINNKPIAFSKDAEYMLRWIGELEDIAKANQGWFTARSAQQGVLSDYAKARSVYENISQDAKRLWGD